jgi:hypothetical protein
MKLSSAVGKDVPGRYVEPKEIIGTGGNVFQPSPCDLKCLGDDVGGFLPRGSAAKRIGDDLGACLLIESAEPVFIRLGHCTPN